MTFSCLIRLSAAAVFALLATPAWPQKVKVPDLSADARQGGSLFVVRCASCHGLYAEGTGKGPPLLHKYYHPGHHDDGAFWRAIRQGSQQHHWRFGDMKPVEGVTDEHVPLIIRYVRELQKANGIF